MPITPLSRRLTCGGRRQRVPLFLPPGTPSSIEQSAGPRPGPRRTPCQGPSGPYPSRVDRVCQAARWRGPGDCAPPRSGTPARRSLVGERRTIDRNSAVRPGCELRLVAGHGGPAPTRVDAEPTRADDPPRTPIADLTRRILATSVGGAGAHSGRISEVWVLQLKRSTTCADDDVSADTYAKLDLLQLSRYAGGFPFARWLRGKFASRHRRDTSRCR